MEEGYVATTWGWSICIEGHKMAWREDPEKWEADRKSPPDPVRIRALPPDKIPFSSHREDPEKLRADRLSPPGPARMRALPPDKIPYDSYRKRVVPPPPDPPATD